MVIGLIFSLWSCNSAKTTDTVIFEEKAGISRGLEYVKITLADHYEEVIFLKETLSGKLIRGEKLNGDNEITDSSSYVFPISIKANEKKTYKISNATQELKSSKLNIIGKGMALKIENEHFIADFNTNKAKVKKGLYPGQLSGIFIKNKNVLLQRSLNNMHWAPNFQKEGLEYKTIGHVNSKNAKVTQTNSYLFEMIKTGSVKDYEEIDLFGQYNFFVGLPYFIYTSTISTNKDVELKLLRNDEMTIDSLFTHLVYSNTEGKTEQMDLYNMVRFDSLTKAPLADHIKWVGFINKSFGYGLISIRLAYNNKNTTAIESPLYQQHTKISASRGNGRYWNRRLIHEHNTLVPKGSKYYEKNAYLVIDNLEDISGQINYYYQCLKNPITVSYSSE